MAFHQTRACCLELFGLPQGGMHHGHEKLVGILDVYKVHMARYWLD